LLLQDLLRVAGLTLVGLGTTLTILFLYYRRSTMKEISFERLPVKSAQRTIVTVTGEPGFPSRSISFELFGNGDISGTVESMSSDEIKVGIRPRAFPGGDLLVLMTGGRFTEWCGGGDSNP
jgi:hypothetical protein